MARQRATSTAHVVAAAAEVFETKGYHKATIDDICEAAGISRPTVYKYIESKPWLLEQMVAAVTEELSDKVRAVLDGDGPAGDKLRLLVRLHIESATSKRLYYATVMSEVSELSDEARRAYRDWSRGVTHDFTQLTEQYLAERGIQPRMETAILSNLMLTMLTSLYRWYDPAGSTPPDRLTEQVLVILSGALPGVESDASEERTIGVPSSR